VRWIVVFDPWSSGIGVLGFLRERLKWVVRMCIARRALCTLCSHRVFVRPSSCPTVPKRVPHKQFVEVLKGYRDVYHGTVSDNNHFRMIAKIEVEVMPKRNSFCNGRMYRNLDRRTISGGCGDSGK